MTETTEKQSFSIKKIRKVEKFGNKINHSELIEGLDSLLRKKMKVKQSSSFINEGGTESTSEWHLKIKDTRLIVILNHTTAEPFFLPRITVFLNKGNILIPMFRYTIKEHGSDGWKKEVKENVINEIQETLMEIIEKECKDIIEEMKNYKLTLPFKDHMLLSLYRLNAASKGTYDKPLSLRRIIAIEDKIGADDTSYSFYSLAYAYTKEVEKSSPNRKVIELIKFWELCIEKFEKVLTIPKIN